MWGALLAGLGIGALAAAQVGPIWLLCVRTSARFGWRSGAAIGLGAAIVDFGYAILGALGAAALLQVAPLRIAMGLLGATVLVVLGLRTLRDALRVRMGAEDASEVVQPRDALRTGIVATASNPLTILTWGAVFSGAAVADVAAGPQTAAAFVVGIGLGSLAIPPRALRARVRARRPHGRDGPALDRHRQRSRTRGLRRAARGAHGAGLVNRA